jgi:septal ring factor EnvC (AmiA/AmiB activator)
MEQMRADISRSQQEVLEIRLATEELWSRLCGSMAPAALTQSLARIRVELAQQHRLVRSELAEQKQEIQATSAQLAEQHQKLARRRDELQAWLDERQAELEKQAGALAAQEQRLAEERAELKRKRETWDSERFRLGQELRRLLRERGKNCSRGQ